MEVACGRTLLVACRWVSGPGSCPEARQPDWRLVRKRVRSKPRAESPDGDRRSTWPTRPNPHLIITRRTATSTVWSSHLNASVEAIATKACPSRSANTLEEQFGAAAVEFPVPGRGRDAVRPCRVSGFPSPLAAPDAPSTAGGRGIKSPGSVCLIWGLSGITISG